jgi:predicted MPP superfamily phosphohydrolase
VIERMTLAFPNLPAGFDGTTVAVISDLHAGVRRGGASGVRHVVEEANSLQPDIIVLLGDMVHARRRASRHLPLLAGLKASEGIWACLGNHEHGFVWISRYLGPSRGPSVDEWRRMYADLGIELLVNEARPLEKDGSRIWLVGVDDAYSGHDDLPAALGQAESDEFCLAITHHPNLMDDPRIGEVDLILAGHTHGGQVRIPLLGPVHVSCRRPRERAAGLIRAQGTTMYVTRGVGEGLPIRFRCPREMPLITLRRQEARADTPG